MKLPGWMRRSIAHVEGGSSGYLGQVGWFRSRAERIAIDSFGNPMPWFTYPAARFLSDRVRPELRILEFGAGMGTMWWSGRVREVVAIEHHTGWAKHVASHCTARIVHTSGDNASAYMQAAHDHVSFDIVIVDGIFRNECLAVADEFLNDGGVIVLDDAQREEYSDAVAGVRRRGFRVLEFHGPQPVSKHPGCTAIFYRDENVLGL